MRSIAYTDCDGNGNSGRKRYAYRDGDSNTDTHSYADSKGYSDAETSADSSPTPVSRGAEIAIPKAGTREAIREFLLGTRWLQQRLCRRISAPSGDSSAIVLRTGRSTLPSVQDDQ